MRARTEKFKYLIIGENRNETELGRRRRWHAPQGRRRPIDRVARNTPINPPLIYIFITVGVQLQLSELGCRAGWKGVLGGLRSATRYIGDRGRVTARVENRFRNDVANNRPSVVIM